MALGRTVLNPTVGKTIRLSYDGNPEWKAGGITIAWSTVAAVASDTTLTSGAIVKTGKKYLRHGQPMCKITADRTVLIRVTGSPTGGSFVVNLYNPRTGEVGTATLNYISSTTNTESP